MDFKGFVRACYLRSVPSVDLETTTEMVDCSKHKLAMSEYDKILDEFGVKEGTDEYLACSFFILDKGPQLTNE